MHHGASGLAVIWLATSVAAEVFPELDQSSRNRHPYGTGACVGGLPVCPQSCLVTFDQGGEVKDITFDHRRTPCSER